MDDCIICLEPLKNNIAKLSCGHKYHFDCISEWINKKKDLRKICPICRDNDIEITEVENVYIPQVVKTTESFFKNMFCCNIL